MFAFVISVFTTCIFLVSNIFASQRCLQITRLKGGVNAFSRRYCDKDYVYDLLRRQLFNVNVISDIVSNSFCQQLGWPCQGKNFTTAMGSLYLNPRRDSFEKQMPVTLKKNSRHFSGAVYSSSLFLTF